MLKSNFIEDFTECSDHMAYMRYVGKIVRKTKIMFTPGNQPLLSELQVGVGVRDVSFFSTKTYFVTPY